MKINFIGNSLPMARNFSSKAFLAMKLTALLLLLACLQVSAHVDAQSITYSQNNSTLESVFKAIRKQTGYEFLYNTAMLERAQRGDFTFYQTPLKTALDEVFKDRPLTYTIIGKTIVIRRRESAAALSQELVLTKIQGTVTDSATGSPLVGVTIQVKGSTIGSTTDKNGRYTLEVPDNAVLLVTYLGYNKKEIAVNGKTTVNINLSSSSTDLNQVVVVGYGTQKKRDVIGSISTIKSDVFEAPSGATNFNSLIQGQAAGVSVQSSSGRLGASVDIKIRGLSSISAGTSPLWVIDGVPIVTSTGISNNGSAEQSPMDLINPSDILSIDILKDAAATAIYGSRGSNGVVIVTTNSGKAGKASVNVSVNAGISQLPFQKVHFLTDSKKWFEIKDEAKAAGGLGAFTMTDYYSKKVYATEFLTREQAEAIDIDWIKRGTQQGNFQSANLSTAGGSEVARYYISGMYRKDNSVMPNEDLKRYGVRANVDIQPLKSLSLGTKLDLAISKGNRGKNSSGGGEDGNKSGTSGGFAALNTSMLPFDPVYSLADPTKYYNPYVLNPVATSDPANLVESLDMYRILASAYAEYSIPFVEGLSIRSEFSEDVVQANRNFWVSAAIRHDGSYGEDGATTSKNLNYNFYLKYSKTFGLHSLDMVVGTESERTSRWTRTMTGRNLVGTYQQLGTPSLIDNIYSGLSGESMLKSYFGRANYKYKDRYLAGISVRRDGSSVFTPDYRWGNFIALSAGWVLSDESFMGHFGANNFIKIRGSYGQTGNASIPGHLDVTNYSGGHGYGSSDIFGTDGSLVSSIGVKDLVWEKTNNLDLGVDFGFLNNRINGSLAYYNKYVHDLLLQSALPPSAGISSIWGNIGDLVNSGVELSVTSYNLPTSRAFQWSTTLNISFNHNEVKKLNPQVDESGTGMLSTPYITKVGYGIREYFLAEFAGVDPETGLGMIYARDQDYYEKTGETRRLKDDKGEDVLLVDNNANMNTNFFHKKGKSGMPTYYGGVTNRFSYKSFELSFLITFSGGNYILDNVIRDLNQPGQSGGPMLSDFVGNYWKKKGDKAKFQRLDWLHNIVMEDGTIIGVGDPRVPMDQSLYKGDFVKLKSVSLSYTLPSTPSMKKVFQNMRVYCTVDNIYTMTKYPGWDPEGMGYVTSWDLPQLFSASVGINIKF